ncbi:hypothetical protein QX201_007726 [Fusarium graminearum]
MHLGVDCSILMPLKLLNLVLDKCVDSMFDRFPDFLVIFKRKNNPFEGTRLLRKGVLEFHPVTTRNYEPHWTFLL